MIAILVKPFTKLEQEYKKIYVEFAYYHSPNKLKVNNFVDC